MKKYAIYGLSALLSVAFVACDNYEEPNPLPQINEQGSILDAAQVSLESTIDAPTYDLAALNEAGELIALANIAAPNLGDYYGYAAVVEMSNNGFAKAVEIASTIRQNNEEGTSYSIMISPAALQEAYYANVSKGPKAKDVQFRYVLYTVSNGANGTQRARIGGEDNVYGPFTMNVTPYPSTLVIEDNYYLVGTACDWTVSAAIKLNHSDLSPYDDPVFSAKFDVYEGWWWKILPESTVLTGDWVSAPNAQYGVEINGDESLAGVLVAQTADAEPQAGCLNVSGPYLLTINMEDLTYSFDLAIECLYTPGGSNGWSQTASQILVTNDYSNYFGFAHLNGEFKFTSAPDWNHINYGLGEEEGKLSTDGGAGNINAGADGLYYCTVNIASLSYALTPITTVGVIGDATPNGWDASTALTPSEDFLVWTGTVTFGAGEFKFRCNDAWDVNLGGPTDALEFNGDNIPAPAAGTYTVTLDLSTYPYTCTVK